MFDLKLIWKHYDFCKANAKESMKFKGIYEKNINLYKVKLCEDFIESWKKTVFLRKSLVLLKNFEVQMHDLV